MNVAGKDAGRVFWTEGGDRVLGQVEKILRISRALAGGNNYFWACQKCSALHDYGNSLAEHCAGCGSDDLTHYAVRNPLKDGSSSLVVPKYLTYVETLSADDIERLTAFVNGLPDIAAKTDEPELSAEALADKAAGFHPMAKPVKAVKEHPGPQKHDAGAVPMKALRIGWER